MKYLLLMRARIDVALLIALAGLMAYVAFPHPAYAQSSVPAYTEAATGTVKQGIGVSMLPPTGTNPWFFTAPTTDAATASSATVTATVSAYNRVFNGASFDRMRGDTNAISVQMGLSTKLWQYTPPVGGLLNTTTAVTVWPAQATERIYVTGAECNSEALGTATEIVLLDGATPLVRLKVPTAGWLTPFNMAFNSPLRGTVNTALTMQTVTATGTGAVYCNWEGYTGP